MEPSSLIYVQLVPSFTQPLATVLIPLVILLLVLVLLGLILISFVIVLSLLLLVLVLLLELLVCCFCLVAPDTPSTNLLEGCAATPNTAIVSKRYDADYEYATINTIITTICSLIVIPIYMLLLS